jgi:hypothetical protein
MVRRPTSAPCKETRKATRTSPNRQRRYLQQPRSQCLLFNNSTKVTRATFYPAFQKLRDYRKDPHMTFLTRHTSLLVGLFSQEQSQHSQQPTQQQGQCAALPGVSVSLLSWPTSSIPQHPPTVPLTRSTAVHKTCCCQPAAAPRWLATSPPPTAYSIPTNTPYTLLRCVLPFCLSCEECLGFILRGGALAHALSLLSSCWAAASSESYTSAQPALAARSSPWRR